MRVPSNGRKLAAFCMQYGPGAENAFPGVATAFSDSTPMLVLPLGHQRDRAQVFPLFSSARTFASVTKSVETMTLASQVPDVMRRAFSLMRMGRPGPVMVEIPADVAVEDVADAGIDAYRPVKATSAGANARDVEAAARALREARRPVIHAGQGVLYAQAWDELIELAELLQAPVMMTLEGKSAFPEDHPLALGTGGVVVTGPILHFLREADLVFGIGCSLTRHPMATGIPAGKTIIHATNDERDLHKSYPADYPILGDAKLVLRQFIEAVKSQGGRPAGREGVRAEIERVRAAWLAEWKPKLGSDEVPISPYRVIGEFMRAVDPRDAIVTHDSGSPRDQLLPFYRAGAAARLPRLGQVARARHRARPHHRRQARGARQVLRQLHGRRRLRHDRARLRDRRAHRHPHPDGRAEQLRHGDRDPASRPVAREVPHPRHRRPLRRHGAAMGGWAERVERPEEISGAFARARKATESGRAALLEFITSQETAFSHRGALR